MLAALLRIRTDLKLSFFCRNVYWLIEVIYPNISVVDQHNCTFVLRLDVNEGMYVNPDQIADYIRLNKVQQPCCIVKVYF